jgi:hypothetical protein
MVKTFEEEKDGDGDSEKAGLEKELAADEAEWQLLMGEDIQLQVRTVLTVGVSRD